MAERRPQPEDSANTQAGEKAAREIGRLLREARLARGKEDLGRIARFLWAPLEHLEALERGDLRHAPGHRDPVALVRHYANHLGLDGSQLAQRLGTLASQDRSLLRPGRRELAFAPAVRLAVALGITLLFVAAPVTGYRTGPEPLQSTTGDPPELLTRPNSVEQPDAPGPTVGSAAPEVPVESGSPAPSSLALTGSADMEVVAPAEPSGPALDSGLRDPPVGPFLDSSAITLELRPAVAMAQEDLAEAYREAAELYRAKRYEQALPLFQKALKLAEARHGSDSPHLALDLNNLGEIYRLLGRHDAAEPLFQRAIGLAGRPGADGRGLASSLNNLAMLYREQGRLEDALRLQERAVAASEAELGPDHPNVATSLNNLAALYWLRGEPARAQPLQERALTIAERALGPDDPMTEAFRRDLDLAKKDRTRGPEAGPAAAQPPSRVPAPPVAKPEPPPLMAPVSAGLPPIISAAPSLGSTAGVSPSTGSDRKPVAVGGYVPSSLAPVVPPPVATLIDAARGTSNAQGAAPAGPPSTAIVGLPEARQKDGVSAVRLASPPGAAAAVPPSSVPIAERQRVAVAPELRAAPEDVHTGRAQGARVGADRAADLLAPADVAPASPAETGAEANNAAPNGAAGTIAPTRPSTEGAADGAPDPGRDRPEQGGGDGATNPASSPARLPPKPQPPAPATARHRQAAALEGSTERLPRAGRFAVLVSSMRDLADVPDEWRLLRQHYPALARLELWPPVPEATESETVYRLVAGSFTTAAEAQAVCDELRSQDQQCRVVPSPEAREDRGSVKASAKHAAGSDFAIQIALVRDPAEALQEWQRLQSRYPSLADFEPRPPRQAEVAGRGTFHGVVGGSFATRAEARAACERLQGEGGECLVVAP